jgi:diaminopimelate epimerase
MKIPFKIYYPGGNTTALVLKNIAKNRQAQIARVIMRQNKSIEQVGFVEPAKKAGTSLHLEMMGGEFCGNAARCAALYASKIFKKNKISLTVSGFKSVLNATASKTGMALELPGNFLLKTKKVGENFIVDLKGIRFYVSRKEIKKSQINQIVRKYGRNCPALGIEQIVTVSNGLKILPWVWVKKTKSTVKETGCVSGSLAAAVVLRLEKPGQNNFQIFQPSGEAYGLKIFGGKNVKKFKISGTVKEIAV